jgi:pimeloyl-ACP methyl ester carboxylesterase
LYLINGYRNCLVGSIRGQVEQWQGVEERWIRTLDGNQIYTQVLPGRKGGQYAGQAVFLSLGNGIIHDQTEPNHFAGLTNEGYTLVFYHPPQYGKSTGVRTPTSDYLAAEAVVQWMIQQRGFAEDSIHVMGQSIGSGPVVELMTHYRFRSGLLVVPLGTVESVAKRVVGPLGYLVQGVIRERYEYNNLGKMGRLITRTVTILQAECDHLMGARPVREAEAMAEVWRQAHPGHTTTDLYIGARWASGDSHLRLLTLPKATHGLSPIGCMQHEYVDRLKGP